MDDFAKSDYQYKIEIYAVKEINQATPLGIRVINNFQLVISNSFEIKYILAFFLLLYDLIQNFRSIIIKAAVTIMSN